MGKKSKLITFDFETGGLNKDENPVMELAIVVTDQFEFEELTTWTTLIKPYKDESGNELKIEKKALDVHGISVSDCESKGVLIKDMVDGVIEICKSFTPKGDRGINRPILCGHNVVFDIGFLRKAFLICGKDLSDYVNQNNGEIVYWDSMQMTCQAFNIKEDSEIGISLGESLKLCGLGGTLTLAHRALPDTRATAKLIKHLVGRIRSEGGNKPEGKSKNKTETKDFRELIPLNRKAKFEM